MIHTKVGTAVPRATIFLTMLKPFLVLAFVSASFAQWTPNTVTGREAIIHLFEWKFSDVAAECERFLAEKGYAGVQVSTDQFRILNLIFSLRVFCSV